MSGQQENSEEAPTPAARSDVRGAILGKELRKALAALALRRATSQAAAAASLPDFLSWSEAIATGDGTPLNFARFSFQRELYRVLGDTQITDVVVMKGTQLGVSELLVRFSLYVADVLGKTVLYVFPGLKQMQDFSVTRVDRLLEHSPYLRRRAARTPWNKGLKRLGSGECHFRGSQSKRELIAVAADVLVLDEFDSLVARNVPEAERRIGGSVLGLIRRVGVPSHPDFGIAKLYVSSDKRAWHVPCPGCGEWQPLVFHKNVRWDEPAPDVIENPRLVCHRCEATLDVGKGEWIAEFPHRKRPGFHVHRLMLPGERNLRNVIEASKKRLPHEVQSFWNNDLGLPWTDASGGLDRSVLAAAISMGNTWFGRPMYQADSPGYQGRSYVTMGVDVASARALNVRISQHIDPLDQEGHRKRALHIGTADSFDEVIDLLNRYQVTIAVVDHLPEMRLALGLAERFPGRVYVCHYNTGGRQIEPLIVNTENRTVAVLRVPVMDAVVAVMRSLRNLLPEDCPDEYVEHMLSPRRVIEKDEYDRVTVNWESKGPDDYFQAEAYDLVATEVLKVQLQLEEVAEGVGQLLAIDDRLEYRRSSAADPNSMEYRPGPGGRDEDQSVDHLNDDYADDEDGEYD
jgi:hypothetical protein